MPTFCYLIAYFLLRHVPAPIWGCWSRLSVLKLGALGALILLHTKDSPRPPSQHLRPFLLLQARESQVKVVGARAGIMRDSRVRTGHPGP